MNYGFIKIQNKGEIDINSLLLLGASSKKENKDAIGYFGSGLKYSIAVLLKNKIKFHIFSGEKEIKVTTVKKNFRGISFEVIKINNRLTSLTTEMGPNWRSWFAVREIYCNAIDEGESSLKLSDSVVGEKEKTTIFISFDERLKDMFDNWNDYFSDKREDLIVDDAGTKIFSGNSKKIIIYRKGIQCYESKQKALFHYDLKWIEINESRIIDSHWSLTAYLPDYIAKIATKEIVVRFFDNYKDTFESTLLWGSVIYFNENWLKVINGRRLVIDSVAGYFTDQIAKGDCLILPKELIESLRNYFGTKIIVLGISNDFEEGIKLEITERQALYITDALGFLKKGGIIVDAPIVVYKFEDKDTLGLAENGEIRLSQHLFEMGKREVISTILEEASHIESGYGDKTREFQNFLFNKLISLLEDKVGVLV